MASDRIIYLLLGRHVGGMEKRFANLYKYLSEEKTIKEPVVFFVSKSLAKKINVFADNLYSNDNIKLVTYGINPTNLNKYSKAEKMIRYLEYFLLALKLICWMPTSKFRAAHFISPASLNFKNLVRANRKVYSFVSSGNYENEIYTKRFSNILKSGFVVDCLSKDLKDIVQSLGVANSNNITVSPCSFIDYKRARVSDKQYKVCFVSRFEERKGIEMLLEALNILFANWHHDLSIHIIGYGSLQNQIECFLADKDYHNQVHVYFSSDPMSELSDSLIFLSLQERENYPSQSLIEAMACSNAIVATDVGLTRELVKEEFGILVQDSESLAEAIEKLLCDYEGTILKGKKAKGFVTSEHTVDKYYDYLLTECYT